jgi:hypothetical protein
MIDTDVPHSARIWNYWLGGKDNYEVDRIAGDEYKKIFPEVVELARASRAFLARTITYLTEEAGIRQFLDIGTGLPTVDNTHEIAQRIAPESRIVYVDNDPLVLVHARALLVGTPEGATDYIDADIHDTEAILTAAAKTLDFSKPVALNLSGIMGHIADLDEALSIVTRLMGALAPGSYLALNDGTNVHSSAGVEAQEQYNESGAMAYVQRTPDEIARFFDGLELVEPGVVTVNRWHSDGRELDAYGGVGRKA